MAKTNLKVLCFVIKRMLLLMLFIFNNKLQLEVTFQNGGDEA